MVSNAKSKESCETAYETLVAAFGEPQPVTSGFRWSHTRAHTGSQVVIELAVPDRATQSWVVWMFDPDAVGACTFTTVDINTPDGLSWLKLEVRRLCRG